MKKIEAIVRHERVAVVRGTLFEAGYYGQTVFPVVGSAFSPANLKGFGHVETYQGREYGTDYMPKVKIEVVVDDDEASKVADMIVDAARTGRPGDGKVFIVAVEQVIRVRTGERGEAAMRPSAQRAG